MKSLIGLTALVLVIGCVPADDSGAGRSAPDMETEAPEEAEAMLPVEPDGSIGDGVARPMLQTMAYQEFASAIEAGAGCSFVADGNSDPVFVATAPDSDKIAGKAAIKLSDTVVVLTHEGVGLAQIEEGGLFRSEAVEVTIKHGKEQPTSESEGTYFWPATLAIAQDEGGSNDYTGKYECGA